MSDPEVPFRSQPLAVAHAGPPDSTRAQRAARFEKQLGADTLIRLARGACAPPADAECSVARSKGHAASNRGAVSREVALFPGSQGLARAAASCAGADDNASALRARTRFEGANAVAMRDAVADIASSASRARTRKLCATAACRAPALRYAGMTPRHYRISLVANERLIAKLVKVTALLGDADEDEPSITEVLELAVDTLLQNLRSG